MAEPLTDKQRDRVLALARAGEQSRAAIAREVGISPSSVSRICKAAGIPGDRSNTAAATQAKVMDVRHRRAEAAAGLLDDIEHARAALWKSQNAQDLAYSAKAVSSLVSAHVRVATVDTEVEGTQAARSMLGQLAAGLGIAAPQADPS
jgi:DNA-binding MurR/RpiR family transcriptional regulator